MHLTVVCEEPRVIGGTGWWQAFFIGLSALTSVWLLAAHALDSRSSPVVVLPETVFRLPVPIAADRQSLIRGYSQHELRALLCTVPMYAELLLEFPQARLSVG
jgi:hypothetical protein